MTVVDARAKRARKSISSLSRGPRELSTESEPFLAACAVISYKDYCPLTMKASDEEYREARSFLRARLAQPEPRVDKWLNAIVDAWVAARKFQRSRRPNA